MKKRSAYQQKIIRNYYQNRDAIMIQSLGEIVSELWLAPDKFKRRRLWDRAAKALATLGVKEAEIHRLVDTQDEKALAKFVSEKF